MVIKYSQNYNLFVFVFNSTEPRTETLIIFCVMILLSVDTWPDFGLFTPVLSTKLRGANQRYSDPTWFGGPISVSLTKKCFDEGLAIHFNFANINLSTIYICIKTYLSCCLSDMSDQNRRYIGE